MKPLLTDCMPLTSTRKLTSSWQRAASAAARARISGSLLEQLRQMLGQHAAAGARRNDDVVVRLEGLDDGSGDGLGGRPVAGVEGRLPAAGLAGRHLDRAARLLEQTDGGEADAGTEEVDEAGHEQRYPRRASALRGSSAAGRGCVWLGGHASSWWAISGGRSTVGSNRERWFSSRAPPLSVAVRNSCPGCSYGLRRTRPSPPSPRKRRRGPHP